MMKVVLDTNCLLVVLPQNSPYRCLWDSFRRGKFMLCYSTEILQEYEELLSRYYSPDIVFLTVEMLLKSPNVIQTIPYYKWMLISADPDDNKFVDCALNVGADYIVTNDKHFNILKNIDFPKINVINIDAFKQITSTF
jgi:putative PIN family toxin of toxin-antitoxin system